MQKLTGILVLAIACCGFLVGAAAVQAQTQTRADVVKCNLPAMAVDACSRLMRLPNISARDRSLLHHNRGVGYQARHDHNRAIRDFAEAIRFNPKYLLAYISRATSYNHKGKFDRAIRDADAAIRLSPRSAEAHVVRSVSYTRKGDFDQAIRDADTAIKIKPDLAAAYAIRGHAYGKTGDIARARADYVHALKLKPNFEEVRTALADLDRSAQAGTAAETDAGGGKTE